MILGLAPSWQPPSRNRCQAAKATCCWGRARARLSSMRRGEGEPRAFTSPHAKSLLLASRSRLLIWQTVQASLETAAWISKSHSRGSQKSCSLLQGSGLDKYVCLSCLASIFKPAFDGHMDWRSSLALRVLKTKHGGRSEPTALLPSP